MEPSTYQYWVLVKYGKLVNKYYVAMTLRFTVMCTGAVKQNYCQNITENLNKTESCKTIKILLLMKLLQI